MDFSHRLVAARKAKGISQEILAEALGISRQAVSKWETGESKPDLDNLTALCAQLDVTMEYLYFGKTAPEAAPPEQPVKSPKNRLVTLGAALFSLLLGFFLGFLVFHNAGETDYAQQLESVSVSNVVVGYDYEKACYKISVLPETVPEGMELELLFENIQDQGMKAKTISCQWDGLYYVGYVKNIAMSYNYRVTAIFHLDTAQKTLPIINFYLDSEDHSYGYENLWEGQN